MKSLIFNIVKWPIIGWILFSFGCHLLFKDLDFSFKRIFIIYLPLFFFLIYFFIFTSKNTKVQNKILDIFNQHSNNISSIPISKIGLWICLSAGLSLYIELMIIRLHSSYFQLFAYFKNISLLSCFLGLGIGYSRGNKKPLFTPAVLPLLSLQIIFMYLLKLSSLKQLLNNPIVEQFGMGIDQASNGGQILAAYGFIIMIFTFNALCFIPLGHLCSSLMGRIGKLESYSWNLIGSLLGILLFSLLSFLCSPPYVWIIVAALLLILFLHKEIKILMPSLISVLILIIILAVPTALNEFDVYSPYQILTLYLKPNGTPVIKTSNTYYQKMLNLSKEKISADDWWIEYAKDMYSLPYKFKPKPKDVLIVGSGSGNDVNAAILNGAGQIDAVEIDPLIYRFGKSLHPEYPYQSKNVNIYINDARDYIRNTNKKYDLIVYGLLDSHTLLSGRSGGVRLDSFVYTVEAFKEARKKLKKDGIISLTFSMPVYTLAKKMYLMLKEAFDGQNPAVYEINYDDGITFLAGSLPDKSNIKLGNRVKEITKKLNDATFRVDKSTDDWPFLYMPIRKYPVSYLVLLVMILFISVGYIKGFSSEISRGFSIPCFFLGAGFMLIETKSITELALVFGSTWFVISIVISAILIMAFLANLLILKIGNLRNLTIYALLYLSLFIGLGLSILNLSTIPTLLNKLVMTFALTSPLFFSGLAFSSELKKSSSVSVALSSNILGAMVGGFLEYNSMYFGFHSLYILAFLMYLIAFLGPKKTIALS